jgi:hypothetical protein
LSIVSICACKAGTQAAIPAPTPLTTLTAPQGGKIVYGTVDGATTQAAAMSSVLRNVHNNCGEKPLVGKVFQFKGTKTVGVFFTVTNHPQGNLKVAGLVISAASGPQQVEAALVSDKAARFGKTVNPMLQQLFSAWHPGGQAAASSSAFGGKSDSAGGASVAQHGALRQIALPDHSATVSLPDGWKLMPPSGGGFMHIVGPNSEDLQLFGSIMAIDPNNPQVRQLRQSMMRYGQRAPDRALYYPWGGDLAKAFVYIYQGNQKQQNGPVTQFNVKSSERIQSRSQNICAHLTGTAVLNPRSSQSEFDEQFCEMPPAQGGSYYSTLFTTFLPENVADKERDLVRMIEQSYSVNMNVVNAEAARNAAPAIANIRAIGAQATARFNATQASNDAQHAGYWAQQNNNAAQHSNWSAGQDGTARNNQGFSNYLLDQSVVEDNNMYGNGTVGHGTAYNSTADALVQADPNRFQIVDTPNYWKGVDY